MNKFDYIVESLKQLAEFWGKKLNSLILKVYIKQLSNLTEEQFERAIELWIFNGNHFPTPEDLLSQIGESPDQKALREWKLLSSGQKVDSLTDKIAKSFNLRGELNTAAYLPAKEYNYRENELKKLFIQEYRKKILNGELPEQLQVQEPKPEKTEVNDSLARQNWEILQNGLQSIGSRLA